MNATCSLCDAPCEPGEALCPSCADDPVQRAAYDAAARQAQRVSEMARWRSAARAALRMARVYRAEGGEQDARARACVEEARRCREAVRRAGAVIALPALAKPGLRKAGERHPGHDARGARRVTSRG